MRDGISRTSSPVNTAGARPSAPVFDWRIDVRPFVLRDIADLVKRLEWSLPLLEALLDELHVNEEFDRLVGHLKVRPDRDAPRLLGLALLLRHSWDSGDLADAVARLGLLPQPLSKPRTPCTSKPGDRGHRRRRPKRTSPPGPRARKEMP